MKSENEKNKKELSRSRTVNIEVESGVPENPYYLKVAKRYRALKYLSLAALVFYLLAMLVVHRSQITYENLVYLAKDLGTDVDASNALFGQIKYDESRKMSAAIYKGRLAVATTTSFTIYNTTGSVERSFKISMENPKVISGDKYVMVYDVGGTTYSIYTTIVCVYSGQTQYTLQGAAISDAGTFALISRARENRYNVTLYDGNFRELTRIYKDKYVMDAALSADGTRYAVASCEMTGSAVSGEVMSGRVDSEGTSTTSVSDSLPLEAGFFANGAFCVVGDDTVSFFAPSGELVTEKRLDGYGVTGVSFSTSGVMVVESRNLIDTRNSATVFSPDGAEALSVTIYSKVSAYALGEDAAYIAADGVLTRYRAASDPQSMDCPFIVQTLVPYANNVLVMGSTSAVTGFPADGTE